MELEYEGIMPMKKNLQKIGNACGRLYFPMTHATILPLEYRDFDLLVTIKCNESDAV